MSNETILRVENLSKRFPGVIANSDITLTLKKGEILAIMGENGAGKSTFCKMLTGFYQPTSGSIYMRGERVSFRSTQDSIRAKISMVYQERNLVPTLTGAQNIWIGNEPKKAGMIDEKRIMVDAEALRQKMGVEVPLDVPIEKLGAGEQQMIEIMRAFNTEPEVLILDEPTAALGEGEVDSFLQFTQRVKETMNIGIIFISHKIEEVFKISDRIAIFTDGRNVLTANTKDVTQRQCIKAMLRDKQIEDLNAREKQMKEDVLLEVKRVEYAGEEYQTAFRVRKGEVVGFYGLVGSGRTECCQTLFGVRKSRDKEFVFLGETIKKASPYQMIKRGLIMTPEKRADGIFKGLSLVDNISALFLDEKLSSAVGYCNKKKAETFAEDILAKNDVKYADKEQIISSLSGGNIQKVIIGRSIADESIKLIILDEPTSGMDIGAKFDVYKKIQEFVEDDEHGVVFISSEIEELLAICDTIYVFSKGNIIMSLDRKDFSKETIIESAVRGRKVS